MRSRATPTPAITGSRALAIARLVTALLLVAGCGGSLPWGWSVWIDNPVADFVVRYRTASEVVYLRLPGGQEGIVAARPSRSQEEASVAVLDPVTCRVVSEVDPVPPGHVGLLMSLGGVIAAGGRDPDMIGDPFDPAGQLEPTDTCSGSDPYAGVLPPPVIEAGDWLEGSEMSCSSGGPGSAPFGVRGEFVDGAVKGCEAERGGTGPVRPEWTQVAVWNPGGDQTRLGVAWLNARCSDGATVSLLPTFGGYRVHVISTVARCDRTLFDYSATFYLVAPLDAAGITGEIERILE